MFNHDTSISSKRSRWRNGLLALACSTGLFGTALAQTVSQYTFSTASGVSLADMTGATTLVPSGSAVSAVTALGFNFSYEDAPFSQFSVNQSGGLRFGATLVQDFHIQNIGPDNVPYIMPFSGEANNGASSVTTLLTGSEPSRTRIIQWNLKLQWAAATCTFQALLHEGSNVIEFRYGNGGIEPWKHFVAIVGANAANFQNVQPSHTSSTTLVGSTDFWPGSGRTYTFTPPAACTAPAAGNTLATVLSGCPGITTQLSLQFSTSGGGVSYQWQSSADGINWNNIGGAVSDTYASGALVTTTWFQCLVTCSTGPSTVASTPVQVVVSSPAVSYLPYSGTMVIEDFSGWSDRCSTADVPDGGAYWANIPAYGAGTWRRSTTTVLESGWDNVAGGPGVTTSTSVASNPSALAVAAPAARFHSRQSGPATQGSLDLYLDMSTATGGERLRFEYINQFGSGNLAVLVSTNGGSTFTQLGSTLLNTASDWVMQEFTIGSTSATTVIRLRGTTSGSGNDIGVDNLRIIPATTCNTPTGVTATVTAPGTIDLAWACSTCTGSYIIEYGNTGFAPGTGATAGGGTVVTATGTPTTISGIPNGAKQLYIRQDCGSGNISENSAPIAFSIVAGDFCANAIDVVTAPNANWSAIANTTGALNNYTSSVCSSGLTGPDVVLFHDVAPGATLSIGLWSTSNAFSVGFGGSCPGTTSLACSPGGYFTHGPNIVIVDDFETLVWTNNGCSTERLYVQVDGITSGGPIYIFNYAYTPAAGTFCAPVTGVAVNTVNTGTGVSVNWNATCSGNVVVEYGPAGFTPGTGTSVPATGTSTTLSGLDLDTAYDLYVRQDCGAGTLSAAGTAASFTMHAGDDCSRVIALSGVSGSIVLNTTDANNDVSVCGSGHNGGDLIVTHVVDPGYGIYFTSAPQSGYTGQVAIAYGSTCPGATELYCGPGAADHFWLNETGAQQTVYLVQDGSDEGTTTIEWSIFEECALYDTDEDGINDCDDLCPELAGTAGDPCTIGGQPGTIGNDCNCVPTGCSGAEITISVLTDANPEQTTWTLYDGSMNEVATGGPFTAANTLVSSTVCLIAPNDVHRLTLHDSFGDGLAGNGYWEVRDADGLLLLRDAFTTGTVSPSATPAVASYGTGHALQLPAGPASIAAAYCGNFSYLRQQRIEAEPVPGASTYQFEFADPDAGFTRRIAVPRNWVRFNEMFSVPLVPGVTYFARVRVDQGAAGLGDDRFGGGCEIALQSDQTCTGLIDDASLPTFSCGVTRAFGSSDKIWTYQVPGATQYRFRFVNAASSYARTIVQSNYQCILSWQSLPLVAGTTYDVSVEAYVGGAWKGYCGPVCQLTIAGGTAPALAPVAGNLEQVLNAQARIQLWPNPNTGGQVNVRAEGFATASNTVAIDVMDLSGKVAYTATVPVMDGLLNTVLDLGHLNNGVYMLRFTTGDNVQVERLVISK